MAPSAPSPSTCLQLATRTPRVLLAASRLKARSPSCPSCRTQERAQVRRSACVTPNHTTPTHAHIWCQLCQKISVSARTNQCRQQDASVGQVPAPFCSRLPNATSCIRYTERLWGAGGKLKTSRRAWRRRRQARLLVFSLPPRPTAGTIQGAKPRGPQATRGQTKRHLGHQGPSTRAPFPKAPPKRAPL